MGDREAPAYPWDAPPAVCEPLDPIDPITGQQNVNSVWVADVVERTGPQPGAVYRCVFKALAPDFLPVELACGLSGALLGNAVPRPCLVRADPPAPGGTAPTTTGQKRLMFGSAFVSQDAFFEHLIDQADDTALSQAVWGHFCRETETASRGAAFDELAANFDRHLRNLRFDGTRWWLIDHEKSLWAAFGQADLNKVKPGFKGSSNFIATELKRRHPRDHGLSAMARTVSRQKQRLLGLAAVSAKWRDPDPQINAVLQRSSQLINLLARRMPMLTQLISDRIGGSPLLIDPCNPPPP